MAFKCVYNSGFSMKDNLWSIGKVLYLKLFEESYTHVNKLLIPKEQKDSHMGDYLLFFMFS